MLLLRQSMIFPFKFNQKAWHGIAMQGEAWQAGKEETDSLNRMVLLSVITW